MASIPVHKLRLPRDFKFHLLNGGGSAVREAAEAQYRKEAEARRYCMKNRQHRKRSTSDGSVSKADWDVMVRECGDTCIVPGCFNSPVTQDHVVPLSQGGYHVISNIQPLCQSCNSSKGVNTIDYRHFDD